MKKVLFVLLLFMITLASCTPIQPTPAPTLVPVLTPTPEPSGGCYPNWVATVIAGKITAPAYTFVTGARLEPITAPDHSGYANDAVFCVVANYTHTDNNGLKYWLLVDYAKSNLQIGYWVMDDHIVVH